MKSQFNVTSNEPLTVGSTETHFALLPSNVSTMPNVLIYGIEVYTPDPDAIFRVKLRKIESYTSQGDVSSIGPSRETMIYLGNYKLHQVASPAGNMELSKHVVALNSPLVYEFLEPIECVRDWQTSTDHFFSLSLTRLDASTAVTCFINIHYSEY